MTRGLAIVALLLAGCMTPFEEPRPPEHFVNQARAALGNVDFTLFHVASHGLLRDQQYVEASRRGAPPDGLASDLADVLRRGAREPVAVVAVAGGGSDKTARVLTSAFTNLGGTRLPHLELLVICAQQHEPAIAAAAQRSGCRLRFARLDG